jgi:hypothetical protein
VRRTPIAFGQFQILPLVFLLPSIILTVPATASAAAGIRGTIEQYALPGGWEGPVTGMVVDPGGTPWILANGRLARLEGESFTEVTLPRPEEGRAVLRLVGGPDKGARAIAFVEGRRLILIYDLGDGKAELASEFELSALVRISDTYTTKRGEVFLTDWNNIVRFDGNRWMEYEENLSPHLTLLYETKDQTYFVMMDRIHAFGADGSIETIETRYQQISEDNNPPWHGAMLEGGTAALALRSGPPTLFFFDLFEKDFPVSEPRRVVLEGLYSSLDVIDTGNGSVLVVGQSPPEIAQKLYSVVPDATGGRAEFVAMLPWKNERFAKNRDCVLTRGEGGVWFGLPENGIAVWDGRELSYFGWLYGFSGPVNYLLRGPGGEVWCAPSDRGVACIRPGPEPIRSVEGAGLWTEYPALVPPWRTPAGEILLFRAGSPGRLSRWDGEEWSETPVPFEAGHIRRSVVSDLGHLVLEDHSRHCFIVDREGGREGEGFLPLVREAVEDGARSFAPGPGVQSVLLTPEGEVWLTGLESSEIDYFDGERWDNLYCERGVRALFPSDRWGMLLQTRYSTYMTYDRGIFVDVQLEGDERSRFLAGPRGLQPFEPSMVEELPGEYLAILKGDHGEYSVFPDPEGFEKVASIIIARSRSIRIPGQIVRYQPSRSGGGWIVTERQGEGIWRLFAGNLEQIPVEDLFLERLGIVFHDYRSSVDLVEDRSGNVWVFSRDSALMERSSELELELPSLPAQAGPNLEFAVRMKPEGAGVRLFTRTDGGPWEEAGEDGTVSFGFDRPGPHVCEIQGMTSLGSLVSSPIRFEIEADFQFAGAEVVSATTWKPDPSVLPRPESDRDRIFWRIADGEWHELAGEGTISLEGLLPGEHRVSFAAGRGSPKAGTDPDTVAVIEYRPDFERIVLDILERYSKQGRVNAEAAAEELSVYGPGILPELERITTELQGRSYDRALSALYQLKPEIMYETERRRHR